MEIIKGIADLYMAWQESPLLLPKVVLVIPIAIWFLCFFSVVIMGFRKIISKKGT